VVAASAPVVTKAAVEAYWDAHAGITNAALAAHFNLTVEQLRELLL